MSDAPETIWWNNAPLPFTYTSTVPFAGGDQYRLASLPATDAQALANPKVQALVEALEWIKTYRKACHNYDDDTDQTRRDFDEDDFEIVEEKADTALAAMEHTNE